MVLVLTAAAVVGALQGDDNDDDRTTTASEEEDDRAGGDDGTTRPTQRTTTTVGREPRKDLTAEAGHTSATDSIGTRYTSAGALVTNPNATWAAYDVSVVFNLIGPGGEVLDTDTANVPYIPPASTVPVAPLQIGFDLPAAPSGVEVALAFRLDEDEGWDGVEEFIMSEGVELEVSNASVRQGSYANELSFSASNPGTQVAEHASWSCVLRRGGVIVGGERSTIMDPIVPGNTVQAGTTLSVRNLSADEVICRAYA